jgi:hypothetical protein
MTAKAPSSSASVSAEVAKLAAYKSLHSQYGADLKLSELEEIAGRALEVVKGLKPPSGADKKSLDGLYKWFQNNWSAIAPHLDELDPLDEEEDEEDEEEEDEE